MKKLSIVFIVISSILFIASNIIWVDAHKQEQENKNEELKIQQSICLDELLFYTGLIEFLAKEKEITLDEIKSFFTYNNYCYLEKADKDWLEYRGIFVHSEKKPKKIKFDTMYSLEKYGFYFLFKNNKFVGIVDWCNFKNNPDIKEYIELKGQRSLDLVYSRDSSGNVFKEIPNTDIRIPVRP